MRWYLVMFLPLVVACSGATKPESATVRVLGAIAGYNSDDPRIDVTPIPNGALVTITTYGDGCHRVGETEVEVHGLEALITPYDYTAPAGAPCTRQLITMEHEASVTFAGSGTARIIVRGLDSSSRSTTNMVGDTIIVERTLELR